MFGWLPFGSGPQLSADGRVLDSANPWLKQLWQGIEAIRDIDEGGEVAVPETGRHDVEVWPHLHSAELQARLFPVATL